MGWETRDKNLSIEDNKDKNENSNNNTDSKNYLIVDADGLPPEDRTCAICGREGSLFEWSLFHWFNNEQASENEPLWLCDGHQKIVLDQFASFVNGLQLLYKHNKFTLGPDTYSYKISENEARLQRADLLETQIQQRVKDLQERRYEKIFFEDEADDDAEFRNQIAMDRKRMWEDDIKNMTKLLATVLQKDFPNRMTHLSKSDKKELK